MKFKIVVLYIISIYCAYPKPTFSQNSIYTLMSGSVLCNFASQYIGYQNQKLSTNINGAYGVRIGCTSKNISVETGLNLVHNANKFYFEGRSNYLPNGFKFPDVKVLIRSSEIPINLLFNIKTQQKYSIQPIIGLSYVYTGDNRGIGLNTPSDGGTIHFKYGNEPWAIDFQYTDIKFEYSSYTANAGFRINYPITKQISTMATFIMRMGLSTLSSASIRYKYYRSGSPNSGSTRNGIHIVNQGNSIGLEFGLKYSMNMGKRNKI